MARADGVLDPRRLRPGDERAVARLCDFPGLDEDLIARELACPAVYCWLGLQDADGALVAVHRSLRWGRHLLLKGLFVDSGSRRSVVGLRMALELQNWAREAGFDGIAAWVEPHRPEAQLAARLRLQQVGPLLHRYRIPVGAGSPAERRGVAGGVVDLPHRAGELVEELLGLVQNDPSCTRLAWVLDRDRVLLSGAPCRGIDDLGALRERASGLCATAGATALEIAVPAADLATALGLTGTGATRLSRTPVRLGLVRFTARRPASGRGAPHRAPSAVGS